MQTSAQLMISSLDVKMTLTVSPEDLLNHIDCAQCAHVHSVNRMHSMCIY